MMFALVASLSVSHVVTTTTMATGNSLDLIHQVDLIKQGKWFKDDLISKERILPFSLVPIVFALVSLLTGEVLLLLLLRLIVPVVLIMLLAEFAKNLGYTKKQTSLVLLMLIASPTLIFLAITDPQLMIILAVQLAGVVLLLEKRTGWGLFLLGIAATEGLTQIITTMAFVWMGVRQKKIKNNQAIGAVLVQAVVGAIVHTPQMMLRPLTAPMLSPQRGWATFFLEIGQPGGLSLVVMGLGVLGALVMYKRKYFGHAAMMALVIISSYWIPSMRVYAAAACAVVAGLLVAHLTTYRWELRQLRSLSFVAIGVAVAFTVMVACTQVIQSPPDADAVLAMRWMEKNLPTDAVVLAQPAEGSAIKAIAKRKVLVDDDLTTIPDALKRLNQTTLVFEEVYLPRAEEMLDEANISHIYISVDTARDKPFDDPSGGLIFLLSNNETFKNVYDDKGHKVYTYLKRDR